MSTISEWQDAIQYRITISNCPDYRRDALALLMGPRGEDYETKLKQFCRTRQHILHENENENKHDNEASIAETLRAKSHFFQDNESIFEELKQNGRMQNNYRLIVGHVQSGKSNVICGIATYNAKIMRRSTAVVVRNLIGDYKQLERKFLEDGSFSEFGVPVLGVSKSNVMDLADALSGRTPSVIVIIANHTQGRLLNEIIAKRLEAKDAVHMDLIIDECDDLAFKKSTSVKWVQELQPLVAQARQVFGVTATPLDVFFMGKELRTKDIYRLQRPVHYKGISDITMVHKDTTTFCKQGGRTVVKESMIELYSDISDEDRSAKRYYDESDSAWMNHPTIVLHKTTNFTKDHMLLLDTFRSHPALCEQWTCIVYNGQGVTVHVPTMPDDEKMVINGVPGVEDESRRNVYQFKNIPVSTCLQWLKDTSPNADHFPNIVIISGVLASRGMNFVSNRDYQWHITDEILASSVQQTVSDLHQSMRISGCYNDDIPLVLYTPQRDINDLRKGLTLQEQLLDGARDTDGNEPMYEYYKTIPVYSDVIPRRKCSKKTNYGFNEIVRVVDESQMDDKEWGIANLRKNLIKAIETKRKTIALKILQFLLLSCPENKATKEELVETCGIECFKHYTEWTKRNMRYKLIVPCDDNTWIVNPELSSIVDVIKNNLDF